MAEVVRAVVVGVVSSMLVATETSSDNVSVQQFRNIGISALINTRIEAPVADEVSIPPPKSI